MSTTITDPELEDRKRAAVAELHQHQERKRLDREAREAAALSVDEEIAREIRARRADEEERSQINAELQRLYAKRDADIAAMMAAEREQRLAGDPRLRIAEHPAKRVALMLRRTLGDQFDAIVAELRTVDFRQLKIELAKIPHDEAAEAKHAAEQALAARLAEEARTLPAPKDDEEAAILARYGFPIEKRQAELNAGVL